MNAEFIQAIERFLCFLQRRYPGTTTAKHYGNDLALFNQVINKAPSEVTRADITQFVTEQLATGRKLATVNRRLASLRSFFNFLDGGLRLSEMPTPMVGRLEPTRVSARG